MKTFTLSILTLFTLTLSNNALASAQIDDRICNYIKADQPLKINRTIKSKRISAESLYKFTQCADMSIVEYAKQQNADKTLAYLNKKLTDKTISKYL
ncbi:DUF3718 domain-containing protein [Colwellia sp. MEBiC06753]